jgi:diguanylate cyclase (GGDEF)-like protein
MGNFRILVIDDDPSQRKTLTDILRVKGYETLAAAGGEEGLAVMKENPVNLVLLDLGLPDIPGLEVLARVKAGFPGVETIILTGNATLDSAIEATNKGAFSYLLKPADINQMLVVIRQVIEKQAAEKKLALKSAELQQTNFELHALQEVMQAISRTLNMDELLAEVLRSLVKSKIIPFEVRGAIFLIDKGRVHLASALGLSPEVVEKCKVIRPGECLCGQAVAKEEIIVSLNSAQDPRHTFCRQSDKNRGHVPEEPHGHIIVPLKAVDKIVGILNLYTYPDAEVDEKLLRLLNSIGGQIGIAINNANLYEETKSVSLHDPLTGLGNRRFMQLQFEKSFAYAKRYKEELSVIMLDIDHFKIYNDTYGHTGGDSLLAKLAGIIVKNMRKADYVFRYGGEEFLAILPGTNLTKACEAAKHLRSAVEAKAGVTISLGVASLTVSVESIEALIVNADKALYRAKAGGRNRVETSEGPV